MFLLISNNIKSQSYEIIGLDAEKVKRIVEINTINHNSADSYGRYSNSHASYDVKYNDGIITEIIQCYDNKIYIDLKMLVNYCEHYLIESRKVSSVIKQFENVQTSKIIEIYDRNYKERKIENLYFDKDYNHFSKIYTAKNNQATIEYRKTELIQLSENIRKQVQINIEKQKEEERIKEIEQLKEIEVISKTYDLKDNNRELYNKKINELKNKIYDYINKDTIPLSV